MLRMGPIRRPLGKDGEMDGTGSMWSFHADNLTWKPSKTRDGQRQAGGWRCKDFLVVRDEFSDHRPSFRPNVYSTNGRFVLFGAGSEVCLANLGFLEFSAFRSNAG